MSEVFIFFCLCSWSLSGMFGVDAVKSVLVTEGESVTLNSGETETQTGLIMWSFGHNNNLVAKINRQNNKTDFPDERFRGRLKLDQTGSLTITNSRTTDSGLYTVRSTRSETPLNTFNLTVYDMTDVVKSVSVMEGDSVTLNTDVTETQKYLMIQWTFRSTRIAEFNRLTQTSSTYDSRFKDRLNLDQTGSLTITSTRNTDSGLYQLTVVSGETKYKSFNVTVNESPRSTSSSERTSSSNCVMSSFVVNNSTVNRREKNNKTELHKPSSDPIHCCGFTEAVIRLVVSALVGVATVAVLVYDIRSTRRELTRTEQIKHYHQTSVESDHQYEVCRTFSSGDVEI